MTQLDSYPEPRPGQAYKLASNTCRQCDQPITWECRLPGTRLPVHVDVAGHVAGDGKCKGRQGPVENFKARPQARTIEDCYRAIANARFAMLRAFGAFSDAMLACDEALQHARPAGYEEENLIATWNQLDATRQRGWLMRELVGHGVDVLDVAKAIAKARAIAPACADIPVLYGLCKEREITLGFDLEGF